MSPPATEAATAAPPAGAAAMGRPPPPGLDPLDHLDASLHDFEASSPPLPSAAAGKSPAFGYPAHRSGFLESDPTDTDESLRDSVSAGGYSPPAWRRLGNGDRSSGFWRKSDNILGSPLPPMLPAAHHLYRPRSLSRASSRDAYDGYGDDDDLAHFGDDEMAEDARYLAQAIRTRLPTGSLSPEKGRSPDPDLGDPTVRVEEQLMDDMRGPAAKKDVSENCRCRRCPPPLRCDPPDR